MSRPALPAALLGAMIAVLLVGCVPEPADEGASSTASSSPASTPSGGAMTPSPAPSASAQALPADCESLYSAEMRATLEADIPPLNDPGIEMLSTTNATLLETLQAVPSLRCTWGPPSERGMTTTVAVLDADQRSAVLDAMNAAGYGCESAGEATICRTEQRGVSLDDVPYTRGETHALQDGFWVATAWLNVAPEGYTEDILAQLRG